ncbi:MAG TPA: glycosyltransferase family 39 protein, partial [Candidatus Saccharimonadales bacterium]|nr:glycosyltransferase family 39 protein [Candidatus Saccharimonadales bacterium]
SLTVLRLISLVSYLLTLPAIYFTGKLATGDKRSGMLAAILLGLSPFMLWYAMRGTMYAPLVLMTVLNQLCFLLVLRKKAWAWPLYVLTAATGLGLHYFFITLLVLQWWFYFIKRREYSRTHKLLMAGSAAALLIGYVLWMHYLSDAIHIFAALPYAGKPSATNAFIIFVQYLFGFQSVTTITFVIAFWPLLVIVALLAVQKYARPPAGIQYATFTAVALILGVFILSWIWRSLFLASYLIIGLPAFFLLVSWYLVALELNILAWARTALVVVMAVMLLIELLHPVRAVNEDYLGSLALPRSTLLLH